jgi:UDP-N-acetylglucosamine diphosphorylase/glucosamine-1-phosphate N-acetyltransferase
MKNIILFDNDFRNNLLPLVFTRPVCELRVGILTVREKWEKRLKGRVSYITQPYLLDKFPIHISSDNYIINGSVLPSDALCASIEKLETNQALLRNGELIAARMSELQLHNLMEENDIDELKGFEMEDTPLIEIVHVWDIFLLNDAEIKNDFALLTHNRTSQPFSKTNQVIGNPNLIFLESGARAECSVFNTKSGPIYLGKDSEVMEGCLLRGSLAVCEEATIKMGAKIYGATTIGPHCKAGGEIGNSVLLGYSNKGHDGYLGNSVLGEWCNLGADTNTSNLKNNYEPVKLWSYDANKFVKTGLQFLGLIMGDHSKCGINTMFNTGTVVGVSANVYGGGYPRNFIPSFSWGGTAGFETYRFEKAFDTAQRVTDRRHITLNEEDEKILKHIFEETAQYRTWEKVKIANT